MHPVSAMQSALRHGFCGPSSPYPFTYTYTTVSSPSRDRVRSLDWPELALIQIAIGIGIVHFEPFRAAPLAIGVERCSIPIAIPIPISMSTPNVGVERVL